MNGTLSNVTLTAIPFYARANRINGSVNVWIAEDASVIPDYPVPVTGNKAVIRFEDSDNVNRFDMFSASGHSQFTVQGSKLTSVDGDELKAILKGDLCLSEAEISTDIHVAGDGYGTMNGGIYLLASGATDGQDMITAYNVNLYSMKGNNDLLICVYKFTNETGFSGCIASTTLMGFFQALMPKYDVNLRVVLKDGKVDVYVNNSATPYLVDVDVADIKAGSVGFRSQFSLLAFDNLTIVSPQIEKDSI
jgi:hypothetical protein